MYANSKPLRPGLWLLLSVLLSACSTPQPVPVSLYYHFPAPVEKGARAEKSSYSSILVRRPTASGIYNERSMLNVMADKPLEVNRYHYHFWSQYPSLMVQDNLVRFLTSSGVAEKVERKINGRKADVIINSLIKRFEQVKNASESFALVRIEFSVDIKGTRTSHEYEAKVKAGDTSIHSLAIAFGKALDAVMLELINKPLSTTQ